ncbi:MAG: NAD(P)/FAD-dependent oxidoreductase [Hyphomicrobiaceae bacterium]|nr:NAD(P)/FAD-dependent oxidoreductase [Hyphomicrobiaceae bacterium]
MTAIHALTSADGRPPHIVIVGAGFAGLEAAKALARTGADVTIIDRRNYHLFQPMLYQVATASLSQADVAVSIRSLFSRNANVEMLYDEVVDIDLDSRFIHTRDNAQQYYDYLIIATGSEYNYFGHEDWPRHAPGLKTLDDAGRIRTSILSAFEKAETTDDARLQKELLTFLIVGAGPTGVELAGSITEIVNEGLGDFRHINPDLVEVLLIEAGPSVLATFPDTIRRYTHDALERRGVNVRLNQPVVSIAGNGIYLEDEFVPASTMIWCAGTRATPAGRWLKAKTARNGAVLVEPDLSLPDHPEVFVAGDAAAVTCKDGHLPALAAVAKQQGRYLGRVIAARMRGLDPAEPFRYRDYGTMATIGRGAAAADFGFMQLTGFLAWLLWGLVHIYYLIGFRNRLAVFTAWIWTMLRLRRRNWLITDLPMEDYIARQQALDTDRRKHNQPGPDPPEGETRRSPH